MPMFVPHLPHPRVSHRRLAWLISVHSIGGRRTGSITSYCIMEVSDELIKELAEDRVEQLLNVLLLIRVLDLVILECSEHLISCPSKDIEGLAAKLLLDEAEQGLIGGARLLGLGLVHDVVGEGEDGDLLGGSSSVALRLFGA